MMVGLVMAGTECAHAQNQWSFALAHFRPDIVYAIGVPMPDATTIGSAADVDLSGGASLVVMSPANAAQVPGTVSLETFEHPADAVYWIGSDARHMELGPFRERRPDSVVYVPTDTGDQMHSFVVWSLVAWDRIVKGGRWRS